MSARNRLFALGRTIAPVALCLALALPALLIPPGVGVYRVLVIAGELAVALGILSVSVRARWARLVLVTMSAAIALVSLAPLIVAALLAPWFLAAGALAALLAYVSLAGERGRRLLASSVIAGSLVAQLLVLATGWLQISSDEGQAAAGACRAQAVRRGGRRYHFAVNRAGTLAASFFPNWPKTEVYALAPRGGVLVRELADIGPNRVLRAPYRGRLLALEYGHGLMAFDPDTLAITEPPPRAADASYFMGLEIRRAAGELLVMRGNGWLSHIDAQTRRETARVDLLAGSWARFNEEMHSIYLAPDERRLVVVKNGGRVLLYDAVERRLTADRHFLEPTGNVVFVRGRAWIATLYSGRLQEIDLATLSTVRTYWLGPGVRYIRELDGGLVAAGNYFTGEVVIVELSSGEPIASVRVGPRIQWMETTNGGSRLWVSHAEGLSALDVGCLRSRRPREGGGHVLQGRVAPRLLVEDFRREGPPDASVAASIGLLAAIGALLGWNRRRGSAR